VKIFQRLTKRAAALAIATTVAAVGSVSLAEPAQAYCTQARWRFNVYTMYVRPSVPSSWQTSVQAAMHQWNGIPGSSLQLWGPVFNSNIANPEFLLYTANFGAYGLPDVPGATLGLANSGTHSTAEVLFNTNFGWNISGTMNQATRQVDVRTIAVHEIGHANGVNHPQVCGSPFTAEEQASVMHPNWTYKPSTNSDDKAGIDFHY
jgi:matrixin